ncbi:DUF6886 family protein [Paenibacillus xanthanilyticus]|uniref:DUF6886 family protein n=1 Tax=Paenibacillus xanthanilyticus TaxID=1783531 RepID=A0ABV8JYF9_9BACL
MLYHFSENPHIPLFEPRRKANRTNMPPVVWAIDEAHEYTFYCPRNCPRIAYRRTGPMSEEAERLLFAASGADSVLAMESRWHAELESFTIYRYVFEPDGFELFDATAGYYISEQPVRPVRVEAYGGLIGRLLAKGIELRFMPELHALRDTVLASGIRDFGIHRFEFAKRTDEP